MFKHVPEITNWVHSFKSPEETLAGMLSGTEQPALLETVPSWLGPLLTTIITPSGRVFLLHGGVWHGRARLGKRVSTRLQGVWRTHRVDRETGCSGLLPGWLISPFSHCSSNSVPHPTHTMAYRADPQAQLAFGETSLQLAPCPPGIGISSEQGISTAGSQERP